MKNRRVAFFSSLTTYSWGGSESLWSRLASYCYSNGHQLLCLCKWHSKCPLQIVELESQGAQIAYYAKPESVVRRMYRYTMNCMGYDGYWKNQFKPVVRFNPDLLFVSLAYQYADMGMVKEIISMKVPYVLFVNGANDVAQPSDVDYDAFKEFYLNASKVYFVSKSNWKMVECQLGVSLKKAMLGYSYYNYNGPRIPEETETHAESDIVRLACIATLDVHTKGIDLLINAMSQRKWQERGVHVTIYGKGQNKKSIESHIAFVDANNISLGGYVDSISDIWTTHQALMLTSRNEGLPLAVIEAMLASKPVIATPTSGISEVVIDNHTGFLAKCLSIDSIDEAMERAWLSRAKWTSIGSAGRQHIKKILPADPIEWMYQSAIEAD